MERSHIYDVQYAYINIFVAKQQYRILYSHICCNINYCLFICKSVALPFFFHRTDNPQLYYYTPIWSPTMATADFCPLVCCRSQSVAHKKSVEPLALACEHAQHIYLFYTSTIYYFIYHIMGEFVICVAVFVEAHLVMATLPHCRAQSAAEYSFLV